MLGGSDRPAGPPGLQGLQACKASKLAGPPRPKGRFSLQFAVLARNLPFQLAFCRFSLRFAVLARVLPF